MSTARRAIVAPHAAPAPLRWWVSSDAVRQAIGAWAATARAGRTRLGPDTMRTAVAVACAIAELAVESAPDAGAVPIGPRLAAAERMDAERMDDGARALTRPVTCDLRRISEIAGVNARDGERAFAVLRGAGVVLQPAGEHGPATIRADYLAPAPAVAAIAWGAVRERLLAVGAPFAAPCAVLRAVGEQMDVEDVPDGAAVAASPPVRISVRDLEAFTGFRRSTVSEAVAALVRARLLDADTRAGHTGRFVLRSAAFGRADDAPAALAPTYVAHERTTTRSAPVAATAAGPASHGSPAGAPVLVGTFAGTPIYAPAGTPLVVECDAAGRWSCRVGPFLQLGPVDPA